jgi:predicted nucleic-acid-binding Zn-ribbon protein
MRAMADQLSAMSCKACGSTNQRKFTAEMDIHFPGMKNVDRRPVLVYPELSVCINCGNAEFTIPKTELELLATGTAAKSDRTATVS